jgi:maleylpyruvate isomerase
MVPRAWLSGCVDGHRRLENRLAATVTEDNVRSQCRLPGWTVGHLLTHLARNADAITSVVESAGRGEVAPMYRGGPAARDAAIEAGAGRPAAELVNDVLSSSRRLEKAWTEASHAVWADGLGLRGAGPATVSDFVFLRWREVEVHQADLGLGTGVEPWDVLPVAYLDREWGEMTKGLESRLPEGVAVVLVPGDRPSRAFGRPADPADPSAPVDPAAVVRVHGTAGRLLAWLMDRGGDPSWPVLRPWSY